MKKRRKDKYNPYTLIEVKENIYIISFKNINGTYLNVEVNKEVYDVFDKSELKEISKMNEFDRHIEHSNINENILERRITNKNMLLEDYIVQQSTFEELRNAINLLPEIQKRRLIKYFFENKTFEQIAIEEQCTKMAVKFSVDIAIEKISKKIKN